MIDSIFLFPILFTHRPSPIIGPTTIPDSLKLFSLKAIVLNQGNRKIKEDSNGNLG